MAASVRYTVFELAERAANARGSLQANVQSFWRLHATDPSKALDDLWTCIQHAIVHSQKCTQVNRVLAFVSAIAHTAAEDVRPEQCTQLLSNLLTRLLPLTTLAEALARHRACLLTSTLLNAPALDGGHLQATQQVLTKRLRDRAPAVREQAVLALTRLCATDAKGAAGPIVAALCALLRTERNKAVRVALVRGLPWAADTMPLLLERTLDVSEDVRAAVYTRMHTFGGGLDAIGPDLRLRLLHRGLRDRASSVQQAAATLAAAWLEACGGLVQLLQHLNVQEHRDDSAEVVGALMDAKVLQTAQLAAAATVPGVGLKAPSVEALSTEAALLWRVVCCKLVGSAAASRQAAATAAGTAAQLQAAAAAEGLEVLEQILPDSVVELMALLTVQLERGGWGAAQELMLLAAATSDMTDAAARTAAVDACQTALASLLQGQVGGAPALARAAAVGSLLAAAVDRAGVADVGASVLAGAGNAWQDDGHRVAGVLAVLCALLPHLSSRCLEVACGEHGMSLRTFATMAVVAGMAPSAPLDTRVLAVGCMGLRCCVEDPAEAELLRQLLDYAQAGDDSATQAAMALCDIACMRGPSALLPRQGPEASLAVLVAALHAALHGQQSALALVLAEGLAKLVTLAAQGTWTGVPATTQAALLSRLLAVQFDAAGTTEVAQALAAWSGRCAAGGAFPARLLVACLVPTARMVAMTGTKAKTERAVRYVLQLLRCAAERHQALDWQVQALAQALGALGAAGDPNLPVAGVKALTAALGKAIDALLPLDMPLEEDARLLVGLCRGASGVGDRAVARSVAAVEESLLDAFDGDALDGNALQGATSLVAEQEAVWASWVALADPVGAGKAPTRRRAARVRDIESDSEGESVTVPASEPRRQPRRSARAAHKLVEEEEEESDGENVQRGKHEVVDTSPLRLALANTQLL